MTFEGIAQSPHTEARQVFFERCFLKQTVCYTISAMRTAGVTLGEVSPSPWNHPRRDGCDGCDGFFESGGGV